ncbi:MAG: DUF507 family protein [Deltaproteobacteria bacterium]|nr:DUF507 family protein [Deltaproteobacteria bacterium]
MFLSEDRINHFSHLILNSLKSKGGMQMAVEERKVLTGIKQAIHEFGSFLDAIDAQIRHKVESLKRNVQEGSREWDILYRQYFEEELHKKGL